MFTSRTVAALGLVALLAGCSSAKEPTRKPQLGINLAGVTDWSSELVFVDAFKPARPWISQGKDKPWGQGGPLDLDVHGNVKSLTDGQFAETLLWVEFENRYPAGTFTCLYDGDGEVDFGFDAKVIARNRGELKVEVKPGAGQGSVRIMRTNPKDPVRNIRVIMPGFENTYQKQPFHPDFLARWKGFKVFRFMDWQATNNSKLIEWTDRPVPDDHSQALGKGVSLEYMIDLCNALDVEPWFCMPHQASDDYVRRFARMVKANLKPGLKVHIEYSNECWNSQFEQARYCAEQGQKLKLSNTSFEGQLRFYAQRSVEVFTIWEEVFGGKERLVRVLAPQGVSTWTTTTILDWKDAGKHADVVAIAAYFGYPFGDPKNADKVAAMSADDLIKELRKDVAENKKHNAAQAEVAKKRGLRLVAYEGGQHLTGFAGAENNEKLTQLFHAVNRHPGMKELYLEHLSNWQEAGGDLFCHYSSMGRYSKWGSWGLLEHAAQDPQTVPKYQAVREFMAR